VSRRVGGHGAAVVLPPLLTDAEHFTAVVTVGASALPRQPLRHIDSDTASDRAGECLLLMMMIHNGCAAVVHTNAYRLRYCELVER
jgi:hypothetical protein